MHIGRYEIIEKLGAGGMGVVYRAMALGVDGFKKPVVIKRVHGHLARHDEVLRRFINEAKIAMAMTHANVVQVLDLGKMGEEYFIALEYIDGRDLRTVIKRSMQANEWPPREISLHIVTEVLRGLDYAHRRVDSEGHNLGIVHRDVTPANILCSFEGEVKLTDFGIARALAYGGETQIGAIRGSIKYMSPEQARGDELDQRSDIFSVGVVLYLLLCKAHPFPGEDQLKVLDRVRGASFLPPAAHGVELPDELETILLTSMAKEREDRYPTAAAMLSALEGYQRTIAHATSSDLQALMQRLFEVELHRTSDVVQSADSLIGAQIEVDRGQADGMLAGVSHYAMTGTAAAKTTPETPRALSMPPVPLEATSPGLASETEPTAAPRGRSGLILALVLLVLLGAGAAALLFWPRPEAVPPAIGVIVVQTEPPGAMVHLAQGGAPRRSPAVFTGLPVGRAYAAQAELEDHAPAASQVRLEGPSQTVTLRLRPVRGTLLVFSDPPQAEVALDGRAVGTTPFVLRLPIGVAHRLTVKRAGSQVWAEEVRLTEELTRKEVHARLAPSKPPRPLRPPPHRPPTAAAPTKTGWVRISTRPVYADVFLGARRIDTTPCRVELPVGQHVLRLVNPRLGISVERKVTVTGAEETVLIVDNFN